MIKRILELLGIVVDNIGMDVIVTWNKDSSFYKAGVRSTVLHNVTEIHYNYNSSLPYGNLPRIAFESDVHHTGGAYFVHNVVEFEAKIAAVKHRHF